MFPLFDSDEERRKWIEHQKWSKRRFEEIYPSIQNSDGLIPTAEILAATSNSWQLKRDKGVQVAPHWRVESVARFLLECGNLWNLASLRLCASRSLVGRAPIFGVPFSSAIKIAMRDGLAKSVFFVPDGSQSHDGIYAKLLVRITRSKESNGPYLGVESWEWIGAGDEVNYVHMLLTQDAKNATHIDGANIQFSAESDIQTIFGTGEKRKGASYEKYFRLDGVIAFDDAVSLVRHWFQEEALTDEYFECIPSWPEGFDSQT